MALERFIPKSPDINIRNGQDFEVAKFGHLNTIVEYINNNTVQPAGLNGYVQFNDNNALGGDAGLFWDNTNKYLGIGTTTPIGILHLYKSAAATRLAIDGDAGQNRLISYRTGAVQRFGLYVNNTAESGSNAGSDFAIRAYSDAGTLLSTPFFINRASGNVGIGTTAPISPLNVYNSSASVSSLILLEQDTSAVLGQIINYRKNGSVNLTSGTELGRLSFGGYFNSTYSPPSQVCSGINGYYGGTGTDRVGGLRLITWNGGGATTRLQVAPDGKIGIGTTAATAKFQILGEGSTSATTSLLVQNSAASSMFSVRDDGNIAIFTGRIFDGVNIEKSFYISSNDNIVSNYRAVSLRVFDGAAYASGLEVLGNGAESRVGIGTTAPNASAKLQLDSTTKGFLPPRMTTAQKNLIGTPAAGLMVYDTTLNKLCVYTTAWETITSI